MAKDYAKFVPPKKRMSRKKTRHIGTVAAVLLIAICCLLAVYYIYDKKSFMNNMTAAVSRLSAIVHHRKDLHLAKNTSKTMIAQDSPPPPVHFDFYNQLPAMQVVVEEAENNGPVTVLQSNHTTVATATATTQVATSDSQATPVAVASAVSDESAPIVAKVDPATPNEIAIAPAPTPKQNIFNPDEVASMLASEAPQTQAESQQLKQPSQPYIIQLGTFETQPAAKQLVSALSSVGFEAKIVKIRNKGQTVYAVQQGPFVTKEMALATKQRLQKRGIAGVIRKAA